MSTPLTTAQKHARAILMDEVQQQGAKLAQLAAELPTVAAAGDAHALHTEVESLRTTHVLAAHGKFALIWFQKNEAPQLFHELARMREITFRASGQGGGSSVDITREDDYYHQLVLWDYEQKRLVGAYRLGITQEVLQQHGQQALYLDHVFHLHPDFFDQIGAAVELTRSFIHPDYQKDPLALSHLWRGLGSVCAKRGIRTLFGSVTIPATVSDASRAVIVEYLRRYHSAEPLMLDLVQARVPFQAPGAAHRLIVDAHVGEPIEVLRDCVLALDGTVCPIPPLIRHYLSMNAKFLGFHVEQEFGNALYCLLHVDLEKAPAAHLKRFLGRAAG